LAVLVTSALFAGMPPAGAASALEQAKARANAAAAELSRAQAALAGYQRQAAAVAARLDRAQASLAGAQASLRDDAIERFLRGGRSRTSADLDFSTDAAARRRADVLAALAVDLEVGAVDRYRAASEDLQRDEASLAATRTRASAALADVKRRTTAAEAELQRLAKLEAQRIAADKAAAAAAKRRAAATPGSGSSTTPRRSSRFVVDGESWLCPVQGPRAFSDDYGDARNGGTRRHQGNDILSPRGTPVVAPVDGVVKRHDNGLGGIAFYLNGRDGIEYYGAHLDSYAGVSGSISQGTVIGWVGNTGDARGGPTHLHFEMHPGGGGPVDPYPTLKAHC
jgi:murein DD-endopeptidase MepM/ murein hydrolase activator NlpD